MGGCQLALVPCELPVGGKGLASPLHELPLGARAGVGETWLSEGEAGMVQRFDPSDTCGDDTMGFFIARFRKGASLPLRVT